MGPKSYFIAWCTRFQLQVRFTTYTDIPPSFSGLFACQPYCCCLQHTTGDEGRQFGGLHGFYARDCQAIAARDRREGYKSAYNLGQGSRILSVLKAILMNVSSPLSRMSFPRNCCSCCRCREPETRGNEMKERRSQCSGESVKMY